MNAVAVASAATLTKGKRSKILSLCPLLLAAACGPKDSSENARCQAALVSGDLILTEVMANPAGRDNEQNPEWFEIYNAGSSEIELSGVGLSVSKADGSREKKTRLRHGAIAPGEYLVVARAPESELPEYAHYGVGSALGALRNSDGRIAITCEDNEIDSLEYRDAGDDGVALQFDGSRAPNHAANDAPEHWCGAIAPFAEGSLGTPGSVNSPCPVGADDGEGNESQTPGETGDDQDGTSVVTCVQDGVAREPRPPVAGDLVITEYMADPENAPDGQAEWIEVLARSDVDLNGLGLGRELGDGKLVLDAPECLSVSAGSRIVFAKSDDSLANGGIEADYTMGALSLGNSSGSIVLEYDGRVLDTLGWTTRRTKGASWSLDPDFEAADSNDAERGCDGLATFGTGGDRGTPGTPNAHCVGPNECVDVGSGIGIASEPRPVIPAESGDLVINEVMADPENVSSDASGEWFEVLVTRDVDLNGLHLGKVFGDPVNTMTAAECLRAAQGTALLFARSADAQQNGELPPVDHEFLFSLTNTKGSLVLERDGELLDAVTWTKASKGVSLSLEPLVADEELNDHDDAWCAGVGGFATGSDQGTPGAENPPCSS